MTGPHVLTVVAALVAAAVLTPTTLAQQGTAERTAVDLARPQSEGRLSFQASGRWNPRVHLNADIAMAYGIDPKLPERLATWRERGYTVHVMTGVAWGEYQDYLYGRWDGKDHHDEVQTEPSGKRIGHGGDVWYMCPTESYTRFLIEGVERALEAGAEALHLEEPEYWVRAGWEEAFKREWQAHFGEPWVSPEASPDAQWKASKLKYFLYRRALSRIFAFAKQWGDEHGREIRCYVPTHSMINYATWGICSPESSLLDVGCDGYIAQVWTGTARSPNHYMGERKERTFETAFLEYGTMQNLVRRSGRAMWFLNDPIEDNPRHSWHDYRTNWESTLVASLLQPEIWRFEIMPWPHRIFQRDYPESQPVTKDTRRIPIPDDYETELQTVISAMGDMRQPDHEWLACGTSGVGVLVSDALMFQQWGPDTADHDLGHFYGIAFPLLMHGMPVEPVQIETADLSPYRVLLASYEGQKPPQEAFHEQLAKWVEAGGCLIFVDDDRDPFHTVTEWWNTGEHAFATPRHHLFARLGLEPDAKGLHEVGDGAVYFERRSPKGISRDEAGADHVRTIVREAMAATDVPWRASSALVLRRGPYVVAAGLEREVPGVEPFVLRGRYLSLFEPGLPVHDELTVRPGGRHLLIDLDACPAPAIVAAACRVRDERRNDDELTCTVEGIADTDAIVAMRLPNAPREVTLGDGALPADAHAFDAAHGLLRVRFANTVAPRVLTVRW